MNRRATAGLVVLGIAVLSIGFYGVGFARGTHTFAAHDGFASDLLHFHWPLRAIAASAYRKLELPLWSPLLGMGFPIHAEGQTALLYPPNVLTLGLLPTAMAIHASVLLHHVIAGLGMFLLGRRFRLHPAASLLAALVFSFGGFFVVHARQLNMTAVAAWLPWLVLAIERARRRASARAVLALAAVVSMILLAGHPQIAYGHALFAVAWVAISFALDARRPGVRRALPRAAALLAIGSLSGALLAAPQVLPLLELNALGPRASGLAAADAAIHDMSPRHLATFLDPYWFGDPSRGTFSTGATGEVLHWEIVASIGIPALLLALSSALPGRRRSLVPRGRLFALAAVFALLSLGSHGPLGGVARAALPGFDLFRFASRYLLHVAFALSLLAGAAADRFLAAASARGPKLRVALAIALPVIAYGDLHRTLAHYNGRTAVAPWTEMPQTAAEILARSPALPPPRVAALDLGDSLFRKAAGDKGWPTDDRAFAAARETLRPNHQACFGLDGLFVYTHLYPLRVRAPVEALLFRGPGGAPKLSRRGANLFGVEWLVSVEDLGPGYESIMRLRLQGNEVHLYRNPTAFPRAFVVSGVRAVAPAQSPDDVRRVASLLADPSLNVRGEAILETTTVPSAPPAHVDARTRFLRYEAERVDVAVDSPAPGFLVLTDTQYPGWQAELDGAPVEIVTANGFARAVQIPPGAHQVTFRFASRSFRSGLLLAAVGVALLIAASLAVRQRITTARAA